MRLIWDNFLVKICIILFAVSIIYENISETLQIIYMLQYDSITKLFLIIKAKFITTKVHKIIAVLLLFLFIRFS